MSADLPFPIVPITTGPNCLDTTDRLPLAVAALGPAATFAWDEFFSGRLRNRHTRLAYERSVRRFLAWLEPKGIELPRITPGMVGAYFDQHKGNIPSKKLELAALRAWFDCLVNRHVVVLNPPPASGASVTAPSRA